MIEQCEAKFKDRTFTSLLVMSELDIVSVFKARHSVRTFLPDFPSDKMNLVHHVVEDVNRMKVPFNSKVEIQVHGPGLGKMGAISHEAGWLLLKYDRNTSEDKVDQAIIDACYLMQHIVMRLTQNAIATVWIVGTFSRKHAEQATPGFAVPGAVCLWGRGRKETFDGIYHQLLDSIKEKTIPA